MTLGEELTLKAMREYYKKLCKIADAAKRKVDESTQIGHEFIAIHNEFADIVNSGETGSDVLKKLNTLQKREAKAKKIFNQHLISLMNKQSDAEIRRDELKREIENLEFRISIRSPADRAHLKTCK